MHSIQEVKGASKIAQVGPFQMFECPRRGDEAPMLMKDGGDGKWYQTDFWDVPSLEEIYDEITSY